MLGYDKVAGLNCRLARQCLENFLFQPSRKWVPFFESGKDKASKGEGWTLPFFLYYSVFESTASSNLRNYSMFISGFHHQIM